jgi:Fur family peroxide stress response transcriptional regulator
MHQFNLDNFIAACKNRGLNVTLPRIAIYKSLSQQKGHPSAEDVYQTVKKEHPNISLATVYKTLEMLAENELIAKVTPLHDMARYDCNSHFHHHFVCVQCNTIVDIEDNALNHLTVPSELDKSYIVHGYRVQFEGLCNNCKTP